MPRCRNRKSSQGRIPLFMNRAERLKEVLTEGCAIRLVEDDIYSALSDDSNRHFYDRRATAYDSVVGTRLYNRIMWGLLRSTTSHSPGKLLCPILASGCWMQD